MTTELIWSVSLSTLHLLLFCLGTCSFAVIPDPSCISWFECIFNFILVYPQSWPVWNFKSVFLLDVYFVLYSKTLEEEAFTWEVYIFECTYIFSVLRASSFIYIILCSCWEVIVLKYHPLSLVMLYWFAKNTNISELHSRLQNGKNSKEKTSILASAFILE